MHENAVLACSNSFSLYRCSRVATSPGFVIADALETDLCEGLIMAVAEPRAAILSVIMNCYQTLQLGRGTTAQMSLIAQIGYIRKICRPKPDVCPEHAHVVTATRRVQVMLVQNPSRSDVAAKKAALHRAVCRASDNGVLIPLKLTTLATKPSRHRAQYK